MTDLVISLGATDASSCHLSHLFSVYFLLRGKEFKKKKKKAQPNPQVVGLLYTVSGR